MFQTFIDRNINDQNNGGALETEINCVNPLTSRRRGHPPKRYRSEGETQKITKKNKENQSDNTSDSTQKKLRKCKCCQGTGHDSRNCKVLSERNQNIYSI